MPRLPPDGVDIPGVAYIVPIVDFTNPPNQVQGLQIEVCQINDLDCDRPLPIQPVQPDPDGNPIVWRIDMPLGLEAFLRLNAPGYAQNEYYFLGPVSVGPDPTRPNVVFIDAIGMPTTDAINSFFQAARLDRIPGTGVLALRVFDCRNDSLETQQRRAAGNIAAQAERASGVQLKLINAEPLPPSWTLINSIPNNNENGALGTDRRGVAGFANLVPGSYTFEGIAPNGATYGQNSVNVRADQITQANLRPSYEYAD